VDAVRKEFWFSLWILIAGVLLLDYTSSAEVSVDRTRFADFPHQVMGMDSESRPLSSLVLRELGLTDYLSRFYQGEGHPDTDLYVGFYASQRTGATYHSPKNCLPGSGWQMVDVGSATISSPEGPVEVNEIVIQKGTDKQVVVYWYHDRGRVIASEYLAKIYMVWDAATRQRTDGALVRVTVRVTQDGEQAARQGARAFAEQTLAELPPYLPG
jgi:EpsI family protein